mmetsp:Transcript_12440/g.32960  ORF Transcript_12440/g.32960 Transcript_12440/m.32960 type:complete len:541 (+) Transcript_12440:91-1713(+)
MHGPAARDRARPLRGGSGAALLRHLLRGDAEVGAGELLELLNREVGGDAVSRADLEGMQPGRPVAAVLTEAVIDVRAALATVAEVVGEDFGHVVGATEGGCSAVGVEVVFGVVVEVVVGLGVVPVVARDFFELVDDDGHLGGLAELLQRGQVRLHQRVGGVEAALGRHEAVRKAVVQRDLLPLQREEIVVQRGNRAQPLLGVALQQPLDQRLCLGRNPRPDPALHLVLPRQHKIQRLLLGAPKERVLAREHVPQNHPARPHVDGRAVRLLPQDLRRDKRGGADHAAMQGVLLVVEAGVERAGEAEVCEHAMQGEGGALAEDVLGLEVAVDDAVVVQVLDAGDDLVHGLGGVLFGELGLHGKDIVERATVAEFHDNEEIVGVFEDVEGLDEVGVLDGGGDVDLADDLLQLLRGELAAPHLLNGDDLAGLFVGALEDGPEGSAAELAGEGVVRVRVAIRALGKLREPRVELARGLRKHEDVRAPAARVLHGHRDLQLPMAALRRLHRAAHFAVRVLQALECQTLIRQRAAKLLVEPERVPLA